MPVKNEVNVTNISFYVILGAKRGFSMKKIPIVILVMILSVCVAALDVSDGGAYKGIVTTPFGTTLSGNSKSLSYKLYKNPSALASNGFVLELPSVSVSVFNVANTMTSSSGAQALSNMLNGNMNRENAIKLAVAMLEGIGNGKNSFMGIDPGFGFASRGFALGFEARAVVRTMPALEDSGDSSATQSLLTTDIVPVVDGGITVGIGFRIWEKGSSYLDIGAAVRYALKYYITNLNAKTVIDNIRNETGFAFDRYTVGGYAIPFDLGLTYGMLDGKIRFSAAVNNLNGYYRMQNYDNIEDAVTMKNGYNRTTLYTPWTVGMAFEYEPGWKFFSPVFSFTFDDINGFVAEDLSTDEGKRPLLELVRHLTARIDVRIARVISLSAAFSEGYPEFGTSLDIWGNQLELRYGYHEAGSLYGSKPVDAFTIRFRLGYDNN